MYAPVSATRYFTGALVAESRVNVTIPALHGARHDPFLNRESWPPGKERRNNAIKVEVKAVENGSTE